MTWEEIFQIAGPDVLMRDLDPFKGPDHSVISSIELKRN